MIPRYRFIAVTATTHKKLSKLKAERDVKSFDKLLRVLIEEVQ